MPRVSLEQARQKGRGKEASQFKKGSTGNPKGRPKGSKNKIPEKLRKWILEAAAKVGEDGRGRGEVVGYLKRLARQEPKTFGALLGKLLPTAVEGTGDPDKPLYIVINDLDARV